MSRDENDYNNYKHEKDEWLDYVKQDVLCTAPSYARYCKSMQQITGFSMKDCSIAPGLELKYFNSLGTEEYEPIYKYNVKYMRWLVSQSIKGGRVCSFNQYCSSKVCDEVLRILSKEIILEGNVYDIIQAYMNYEINHLKIIKEEYESKFKEYRDKDEKEMNNQIKKKLGEFPFHNLLQELSLNDLLWDFNALSLYPIAMSDPESNYPRIETG